MLPASSSIRGLVHEPAVAAELHSSLLLSTRGCSTRCTTGISAIPRGAVGSLFFAGDVSSHLLRNSTSLCAHSIRHAATTIVGEADATLSASPECSLTDIESGDEGISRGVGGAVILPTFNDWGNGSASQTVRRYSTVAEIDTDSESTFETDSDSDVEEGDVIHVDVREEGKPDELAVKNLGLVPEIEKALFNRGIERLFPIQRAVLEPSMAGRDVIARAKTGTGKTLAFGIPILEKISRELEELPRGNRRTGFGGPRCLVLAPTRELAKQVEREFSESAPHLSTLCVYGGVSIETQIRALRRGGVHAVVGTPGRIMDLIDRGCLPLSDARFCVLDEADQMLAVGFEEDVERILQNLPAQRQTALFSATMPTWVKKLSRKYLNNPLTVDLVGEDEDKLAEGIRIMSVRAAHSTKRSLLVDLITVHAKGGKTIVFTQTKRDADDVSMSLGRTVGCEALHGDIAQQQRERTLQAFREGRFAVLVATDVASRGLDIPNVDLVIHYEIPNDPETFVHRSGRTGRAGKLGSTILMYTDSQSRTLRNIERDVGCRFERISPPHVDDILEASAGQAVLQLSKVHEGMARLFLPTAEKILEEQGPLAFAAAIAQLTGITQPPAARSLLTNEQGSITVRVVRTATSRNGPLVSARNVLATLSEIYRPAADAVGKIKIIADRDVEGAVFDLPEKVARDLVALKIENGDVFDLPKTLPALIEEESRSRDRDSYGRFGSQGGGGRGGGSRSISRGGARGGGAGRGDRGGGRDRERNVDRYSSDRDSRGSSRSSSSGGGSRFGTPRRSMSSGPSTSSSWDIDSDSDDPYSYASERPLSARRDRDAGFRPSGGASFSGVCFVCKKSGHRAADCPVVMER